MEKYSFVHKLGQGSFAIVWKGRSKSDGRLVAVKQLRHSPDSWEECKKLPEVRAAAAIQDRRNVVQLLEAVRHGGELFLVFEYVESSLHNCTAQAKRLEEAQVRWAARRLLGALAAVHAAGLVHCDVKPENILVGADASGGATLKLCDFGQATTPEHIATYVGTRWYRAPELFLGARGDAGVDLWAAGVTLAELFLRRPLVPGSDTRDMLFRICGEIGPPSDEDAWLLAPKMVEVSGRPNARAAAWDALAEAGASEAAIEVIRGVLRYNGLQRWRASRALKESRFLSAGPEFPIEVPSARPVSPETRRRQREEATAVERRLTGGKPSGPNYSNVDWAAQGARALRDAPIDTQARSPEPQISPAELGGMQFGNAHPSLALPTAGKEDNALQVSSPGSDDEEVTFGDIFKINSKAGQKRTEVGADGRRRRQLPSEGGSNRLRPAPPEFKTTEVAAGASSCGEDGDGSEPFSGAEDDEALAERFWTEVRSSKTSAAPSPIPPAEHPS